MSSDREVGYLNEDDKNVPLRHMPHNLPHRFAHNGDTRTAAHNGDNLSRLNGLGVFRQKYHV